MSYQDACDQSDDPSRLSPEELKDAQLKDELRTIELQQTFSEIVCRSMEEWRRMERRSIELNKPKC